MPWGAFGFFFFFMAGVFAVVVWFNLVREPGFDNFLVGILVVMALFWGGVGLGACLKRMGAVYAGLVLSYLNIAGNLLSLNICALAITAAVIIQAHRVINMAGELRRKGIPLTARVEKNTKVQFKA